MNRVAIVCLLLCTGALAQSSVPPLSPEVNEHIQRQIRAYFNIPPDVDIKIGTPSASEFPNYELVPVTISRGEKVQKTEFLLSSDDKTLVRFTKIDLTKDLYAETMSKINLTDRPVRGNPQAKVTVVNFDDFECPFCARMHQTLMSEILPEYGNEIKIVYKDYPLVQIHPWAEHAAIDANCLAKESGTAYWQLADYLHGHQRTIAGGQATSPAADSDLDKITLDFGQKNGANMDRLQACIKAQSDTIVKASIAEGDSLGVGATPTVFINGERLEGAVDAADVRAAINRQLLAQGIQPPPPPPAPTPAPTMPPMAPPKPAGQ